MAGIITIPTAGSVALESKADKFQKIGYNESVLQFYGGNDG